jgi:hypothetical protein
MARPMAETRSHRTGDRTRPRPGTRSRRTPCSRRPRTSSWARSRGPARRTRAAHKTSRPRVGIHAIRLCSSWFLVLHAPCQRPATIGGRGPGVSPAGVVPAAKLRVVRVSEVATVRAELGFLGKDGRMAVTLVMVPGNPAPRTLEGESRARTVGVRHGFSYCMRRAMRALRRSVVTVKRVR